MEFQVEEYRLGDEVGIVELLQLVFNRWPQFDLPCTALEHWKWKYLDNPLQKRARGIFVAKSDGKIVGCSHSSPCKLKIGDRVILSSNGYDLAVHPNFRGLGIASKLEVLRDKGRIVSGIVYAPRTSGNSFWSKHISKKHPKFPHDIRVYVHINDINLHFTKIPSANSQIKRYGFLLVKLFTKFSQLTKFPRNPTQSFHIMEIQRFNEDINGFSESVKNYYNYVIVKNQEYLNWRYCENRGGSYVIYLARDNEKILGFIVLRINVFKDDYPRGYIVDMLALPKRLDVMNALVNDSVLFFNNKKVNIISCQIVRSHPYEKILKKHGFVYSQQNKSLFYTVYAHFDDELKRVEESLGEKISFPFGDRDDI